MCAEIFVHVIINAVQQMNWQYWVELLWNRHWGWNGICAWSPVLISRYLSSIKTPQTLGFGLTKHRGTTARESAWTVASSSETFSQISKSCAASCAACPKINQLCVHKATVFVFENRRGNPCSRTMQEHIRLQKTHRVTCSRVLYQTSTPIHIFAKRVLKCLPQNRETGNLRESCKKCVATSASWTAGSKLDSYTYLPFQTNFEIFFTNFTETL